MQVQHIPRRGRLLLVLPIPCKHTRTHITYDINVHGRGSVNIVWAQLIASQAFCNSTACAESAHGATSTLCKWKRRDSRQNEVGRACVRTAVDKLLVRSAQARQLLPRLRLLLNQRLHQVPQAMAVDLPLRVEPPSC